MIESTKDILFLVLSVSIAFFTFFLCYLLFYLIKVLKEVTTLVEDVKERFDQLHRTVESGFNYLGMLTEGIKMAMGYFDEKKTTRKKTKSKTK